MTAEAAAAALDEVVVVVGEGVGKGVGKGEGKGVPRAGAKV